MGQACIYWDMEHYSKVQTILQQSTDFCSEHEAWKLNCAHTFFMQGGKDLVQCSLCAHLTIPSSNLLAVVHNASGLHRMHDLQMSIYASIWNWLIEYMNGRLQQHSSIQTWQHIFYSCPVHDMFQRKLHQCNMADFPQNDSSLCIQTVAHLYYRLACASAGVHCRDRVSVHARGMAWNG